MASSRIKVRARGLVHPVARFIADLGIPPTAITVAGLGLAALSGLSIGRGHFLGGGILLIVSGLCDMIDGASAREGGRTSRIGAFLDSTVDRYSEVVVLLGALVYYLARSPGGPEVLTAAMVFLALAGSFLVSYTRARAEAVGESCEIGLAERPERLVILIVGALLGATVFRIAIWAVVILAHFTAIQRIRYVLSKLRGSDGA